MHKTCYNCAYYHGCLAEEDASQYHIHDYCEIFKTVLPFDMESEINKFLDEHWHTMCEATADCYRCVYTDLETGDAYCYQFMAIDKESLPDERFEANKKHNRELAIKTLEYMFEKDKVLDEFDGCIWHKLDDYYSEDEIAYYRDLLKRLKETD